MRPRASIRRRAGRGSVKFCVKADGSTGGFTMVSPGPAAVGVAIVRAVHECKWLPGGYVPGPCSDPLDRAAAVTMPTWVVQPIRFAGP